MQEHQQNNKNDQVDNPVISDYNPLRHAIIANIVFLIIFIIIGLFTLVSGIVTIKQTGFSNNVFLLFSLTTVMFILCLIFCIVLSQAFISRHSNYKFDYIIIDRTAFITSEKERITKQIVPSFIYKASYPAWFLSEAKFIEAFFKKYELIDEFKSPFDSDSVLEDGVEVYRKGFYFKRLC